MNANAALAFSQGHHPANHRSAIPTRVYESGSGHGHDAAPAGHPHPPRPPPGPATLATPCPRRPIVPAAGRPASRAPSASLRERCAPLDPGHHPRDLAAIRAMGPARHAPHPPGEPRQNVRSQHKPGTETAKLDRAASYECANSLTAGRETAGWHNSPVANP
jgi:hypothetical protein